MKNVTEIVLFILLPFSFFGQNEIDYTLMKYNKVATIDGFQVALKSEKKLRLLTKETFNKEGRRTSIKIFKRKNQTTEYVYHYLNDTIKTHRETKKNDTLLLTTKLFYDSQKRHVKSEDFDEHGQAIGTYELLNYDDLERSVEWEFYSKDKLRMQTKTINDDHGNKRILNKRNGEWVKDNPKQNEITQKISNYNEGSLDLVRKTEYIKETSRRLGLVELIDLNPHDILITEKYKNKSGLIEYELQILNSKKIGKKRYEYSFYDQ